MFGNGGLRVVDVIGKPIFPRFFNRDTINELLLDEKFFKKIIELEIKFNNDPSIVGLSGHIQMIGKKIK